MIPKVRTALQQARCQASFALHIEGVSVGKLARSDLVFANGKTNDCIYLPSTKWLGIMTRR